MSINLSVDVGNDAGDAIVDRIDDGSSRPNGYLVIRTGEKPISVETAATGTLLATCNFSNPAYGNFSNKTGISNPIGSDTDIANNGIAGWFRVYNRDDVAIFDGDIGYIDSDSDLEFNDINFIKGGSVSIDSLIAVIP